ncbi:MAG: hypothetical protein AB7P37_04795 [Ramlibacter sp.]
MERITGPFKGYFIAAYTVESGDEFIGFAKICIAKPDSVHNINAQHKVRSYHLYSSESQALESAEFRARESIASLPPNWHPFSEDSMMDSLKKF